MQRKMNGQVVLITGASAGIGAALAIEAASRGADVALLARRGDRIEQLAEQLRTQGVRSTAAVCDVTNDESVQGAVAHAVRELGAIDMVLANAGFGVRGDLQELTLEDYKRQFDTNVFGVLRTIYATLDMLKQRTGMLGIVGSANGYLNVPNWSAYCMSKACIRSLCACIRHELARDGVSVTHLAPGFIDSEFRRIDNGGQLNDEARDPVPPWLVMSADKAAKQMLDAVLARKEEAVITLHAKAVVALERHAHWLVSESLKVSGPLVERFSKD